jgi:hypothetical protein
VNLGRGFVLEVGYWLLVLDELHETVVGDETSAFHLPPLAEAVGFDFPARHEFVEFGSPDTEKLGGFIHPNKLGLHYLCWIGINH